MISCAENLLFTCLCYVCSHFAYDNMCSYLIVSVPVTLACAMFLFVLPYELISPTLSYTAHTHITVELVL